MKTHRWQDIKAADPDLNTPKYRAAYAQARLELELGARVRELRTAAGLSQSQLARLVGTRQPNIARLEAGGGMPRFETLQRIADALGVRFAVSLGPAPRRRVTQATPTAAKAAKAPVAKAAPVAKNAKVTATKK